MQLKLRRDKEGHQASPSSLLQLVFCGLLLLILYMQLVQQRGHDHYGAPVTTVGSADTPHWADSRLDPKYAAADWKATAAAAEDWKPTAAAAAAADWKATARCNGTASSLEYVKLMEQLLNPKDLLNQVVKQQGMTWLQIGSNTMDAKNGNDPLKKLLNSVPSWNKVFVEPIPQLYAKLEQSIKRWPNSTAVNVALSPDRTVAESKAKMWCYGAAFATERLGKDLPTWANQICSFNASHIGRHFKGKRGVPVEVTAVSLEELLRRTGIQSVQVLVIDTEGFDYSVLQQIPFDRLRPAFVLWEHKHLHERRQLAEQFMRSHCYAVKQLDMENTVGLSLFV